MTATLSDAAWAVLYHVYYGEILDADGLALFAAFEPPLPYRRGDFTEAECRAAIETLFTEGWLMVWTEEHAAEEEARWESEPLPLSVGVERDIEPGSVGLTRIGWIGCDNRWGVARNYLLMGDAGPGVVRILADSEAACMTRRDQLVADINERGWIDSQLERHPGPVTEIGPVERIRGWWYNRFVCIRPGFQCLIRYA